ncbi:MAG: hypothetical protein DRO40_02370 [Thermoprotei archaeon]|nr:MAG: hypothetical protein DRO40_02370 [Thermoprotei archaeon]
MKTKYTCIVCGRKFPHGQGIVIEYGTYKLTFHSSRCASRFLKLLLERVPEETLGKYIGKIIEEFEERLELLKKVKAKRI